MINCIIVDENYVIVLLINVKNKLLYVILVYLMTLITSCTFTLFCFIVMVSVVMY
jgi:hypothetical protein